MRKNFRLLYLLSIPFLLFIISCLPSPEVTNGNLTGQVLVPENTFKTKDLSGVALPDATINIVDLSTGEIIATTTTDVNGYYQVSVPAGGPYLLVAIKDEVKLEQITCQVEEGMDYDLGETNYNTTAVALIFQERLAEGENINDINCTDIENDPNFSEVEDSVYEVVENGGDPTTSSTVEQAVEDFLNPPPPSPTPTPTPSPTYTVTYDGNGNTGGAVPTDTNTYQSGETVTIASNTGSLEKSQDGISLLFIGWNTTAIGNGTDYAPADTFSMGSSDITLYAKWQVIGATGPAGGLVFYDKGSVSDGWRYLEAAPNDQSAGIQWYNGTYLITGAIKTGLGTGSFNSTSIILEQGETSTDYAAGLARAYDGGGYHDWYLPSKAELNQLYLNREIIGNFKISSYYWSSSEYDVDQSWNQYFGTGYQGKPEKWLTDDRVRAVRIFRSTAPTYVVNYHANGATGGTVPSDSYHYEQGESVTVSNNTGVLVNDGYTFDGWNTAADGSGTYQAENSIFDMGSDNVTLYAKWAANTYTVTYDGNGNTGGTAPSDSYHYESGESVTVLGNTGLLFKIGGTFDGWNTKADGNGTERAVGSKFDMGSDNVTLYAQWNLPVHNITKGTYFSTIEAAITAAVENDEIIVAPGTYMENIEFDGTKITVKSIDPLDPAIVAATIIDGGATDSVIKFNGGYTFDENKRPILEGFTIQNGSAVNGGGIYMSGSSPIIRNNIIGDDIEDGFDTGNTAEDCGGGIYIYNSDATLIKNIISGNEVTRETDTTRGGGIDISTSLGTISENIITDNYSAYHGGGMSIAGCQTADSITIEKNEIKGNHSENDGGGIFVDNSSIIIGSNNLVEENSTVWFGGGIAIFTCSTLTTNQPTISDNNILNNTAYQGGGIYINASFPFIINNEIKQNKAEGTGAAGGGIYVVSSFDCYPQPLDLRPTGWGAGRENVPKGDTLDPEEGVECTIAGNNFLGNEQDEPLDYTEGAHVYFSE